MHICVEIGEVERQCYHIYIYATLSFSMASVLIKDVIRCTVKGEVEVAKWSLVWHKSFYRAGINRHTNVKKGQIEEARGLNQAFLFSCQQKKV